MRRPTRRQFVQSAGIAGLAVLAGCGRFPWQGQPPTRVYRIGYISVGSASGFSNLFEAFRQAMRELGYIEEQNVIIAWQLAEREDQLPDLAAKLVRLPVDVIVAGGTPAIQAAKNVTATVPIVMATSGDPVQSGFAVSLARPGRNITGLSLLSPTITSKRFELFKEIVPRLSRVAVLSNPANSALAFEWRMMQEAARIFEVELQLLEVRGLGEIDSALEVAIRERADGLIPLQDTVFTSNAGRITDLVAKYRLPAMYPRREFVGAGGLAAFGPDVVDMYRRAATYVDKILNGTKPADLPVEQPREFDFVINLKTAQALGLTIPQSVLVQATEIIQ